MENVESNLTLVFGPAICGSFGAVAGYSRLRPGHTLSHYASVPSHSLFMSAHVLIRAYMVAAILIPYIRSRKLGLCRSN